MAEQEKESDLVEVLKRSGSIRKDWGLVFGSIIMNRSINAAAGRKPIWWALMSAAAGSAMTWLLQAKGWPPFLSGWLG